jgi:hypothetical protein
MDFMPFMVKHMPVQNRVLIEHEYEYWGWFFAIVVVFVVAIGK